MEWLTVGIVFSKLIPIMAVIFLFAWGLSHVIKGYITDDTGIIMFISGIITFVCLLIGSIAPMKQSILIEPEVFIIAKLHDRVAIQVDDKAKIITDTRIVKMLEDGKITPKIRRYENLFGCYLSWDIVYE